MANDSVKWNELWQIDHGFPVKLIRLARIKFDDSKSNVRITDETSEVFVTLEELKQGDALSNLLFNIALEGAVRRSDVQRNGAPITKSHILLGYADDIQFPRPKNVHKKYAAHGAVPPSCSLRT